MYNELNVIGYLGKDPETQFTATEDKVVKVSVGSTVWDKINPYTIWVNVAFWGKAAEYTERHLHKGDMVHIVGTLIADKATGSPKIYQRKDGTSATSYDVKGRLITRLARKTAEDSNYEDNDDYLF